MNFSLYPAPERCRCSSCRLKTTKPRVSVFHQTDFATRNGRCFANLNQSRNKRSSFDHAIVSNVAAHCGEAYFIPDRVPYGEHDVNKPESQYGVANGRLVHTGVKREREGRDDDVPQSPLANYSVNTTHYHTRSRGPRFFRRGWRGGMRA